MIGIYKITSPSNKIYIGQTRDLVRREKDYKAIYKALYDLNTHYDTFVDIQKHLVLAIAYNNDGRNLDAFKILQNVLLELSSYKEIQKIYFLALYNLFICSFNLKKIDEMKICLARMTSMKLSDRQKAYYLNCLFQYSWFSNNDDRALEVIDEIKPYKKYMSESMTMAFAIGRFMFYFKNDEYQNCYKVLNEIKKVRSYYNQSNFIYMKSLLDHVVDRAPIYVYERSFKDNMQLFHQLMVIKCLEEDNQDLAHDHWLELQSINRFLFSDDFKYNGKKDLFSVALSLHQHENAVVEKNNFKTHEEALYHLLLNATSPVSVEKIYAYVWDEKMPDKLVMTKLKKLVSRVRVKYAVEIAYRKCCYQIVTKNVA
jgi:hypothetical protein